MRPWSQPLLWPHPSAAVACDPYFGNVVLLMGYEGVNGSTGAPGMTDESPAVHGTGTIASPFKISTTKFKFGSSSLSGSPGTSGLLWFPHSTDFNLGSGLFTIEAWVNFNTIVANYQFIVAVWQTPGNNSWALSTGPTGTTLNWNVSTTGSDNNADISGAWSPTTNTWYHVAVDYDGTKYRGYVNGTMV